MAGLRGGQQYVTRSSRDLWGWKRRLAVSSAMLLLPRDKGLPGSSLLLLSAWFNFMPFTIVRQNNAPNSRPPSWSTLPQPREGSPAASCILLAIDSQRWFWGIEPGSGFSTFSPKWIGNLWNLGRGEPFHVFRKNVKRMAKFLEAQDLLFCPAEEIIALVPLTLVRWETAGTHLSRTYLAYLWSKKQQVSQKTSKPFACLLIVTTAGHHSLYFPSFWCWFPPTRVLGGCWAECLTGTQGLWRVCVPWW